VNDQPAPPPKGAIPVLDDYPHRVTDIIRFADLDPQGHVNNAIIATYFETGRVAMFRLPDLTIGVPGVTFVLVHTEINYLKELRWPGTVDVGTALARFGQSSFTLDHAVFKEGVCAATGSATMVAIDKASRRARPLPEELIAKLSRWKRRDA